MTWLKGVAVSTEENINKNSNQILHFTAQKNKMIVAVCLISIMVLMWGRIFFSKKTSEPASGLITPSSAVASEVKPKRKITYIELPTIEGRHDFLKTNFFDAKDWEGFEIFNEDGRPDSLSGTRIITERAVGNDTKRENVLEAAKELKLEAIAWGQKPQAFINGKLVSAGQSLNVKTAIGVFEFEVIFIYENKVELKCDGIVIVMQIAQPAEAADQE